MAQTVNVPGVGQLQFPDGMSQADMASAIQRNFPQIHQAANQTEGNSFLDNVAAGIGKGMTDFAYGAKQRLDDAAAYLEKKIVEHGGGAINDSINGAFGLPSAAQVQQHDQQLIDEKRAIDAPLMATGGGKVGNFIGQAASALLVPAGGGLAGSVAAGGALGAMMPTTSDESVLKNAALGAVGGAAGYGVAQGVSRILSPAASKNPALQALKDQGIDPTIGQTLGGAANKIEQKAQSIPFVGDAISSARRRVLEQFNNVAINRATAPIGVKIDGFGQDAVAAAGDALSNAYDQVLTQVPHVTLDSQFAADLTQLHGMAQNLTEPMANKFNNVLSNVVLDRVSPQGSMLGDTYKAIDSELGNIAGKYSRSSIASESEFGDAVAQLKNLLNENMRRSNPQVAATLGKIDTGWANLVRIEAAAKAAKNTEGLFTPTQLNAAVQAADNSVRGRAVARGQALMQDLSGAGQSVLGSTVPDSGTAGREALMRMGLNGGTAGAAGAGLMMGHPGGVIGLAGGVLAYSKPMQNILNNIITRRPDMVVPVANTISKYAGAAGVLGAVTAVNQRDRASQAMSELGAATNLDDAINAAQRVASP